GLALAIADDPQLNLGSGTLLADDNLQLSGIVHLLAVDLSDHIADFQASLGAGRIRFDLADQSPGGFLHVEELHILRSYIRDADADAGMLNLAVLEQALHHRPRDLRRDSEAHAGK